MFLTYYTTALLTYMIFLVKNTQPAFFCEVHKKPRWKRIQKDLIFWIGGSM